METLCYQTHPVAECAYYFFLAVTVCSFIDRTMSYFTARVKANQANRAFQYSQNVKYREIDQLAEALRDQANIQMQETSLVVNALREKYKNEKDKPKMYDFYFLEDFVEKLKEKNEKSAKETVKKPTPPPVPMKRQRIPEPQDSPPRSVSSVA